MASTDVSTGPAVRLQNAANKRETNANDSSAEKNVSTSFQPLPQMAMNSAPAMQNQQKPSRPADTQSTTVEYSVPDVRPWRC